MSFEALRADLESMQKSMTAATEPAITTTAAAPAADGAAGPEEGATDSEGGEVLGKSFTFQLADGTEIEATDGTALVKALGDRLVATEESLAKAQAETVEVITLQSGLIKSLSAQVQALLGAGAGRRSVLRVTEAVPASNTKVGGEQALGKSLTFSTGRDAMAAAEAAYKADRISSLDLAKCETFVGRGLQFPADLAAKVAGV